MKVATQPSLAFWFFCLSCLCESHVRPFVLCVLLLLFYQWVNRLGVRGWTQQSFARRVFALIKHSVHVFFFKSRVKKEQIHTSVLIFYRQCFINNPPQKLKKKKKKSLRHVRTRALSWNEFLKQIYLYGCTAEEGPARVSDVCWRLLIHHSDV